MGGISLIWKIVLVVELLGRSNGIGFKLVSDKEKIEASQNLKKVSARVQALTFL